MNFPSRLFRCVHITFAGPVLEPPKFFHSPGAFQTFTMLFTLLFAFIVKK
jgi:hypothetical protein